MSTFAASLKALTQIPGCMRGHVRRASLDLDHQISEVPAKWFVFVPDMPPRSCSRRPRCPAARPRLRSNVIVRRRRRSRRAAIFQRRIAALIGCRRSVRTRYSSRCRRPRDRRQAPAAVRACSREFQEMRWAAMRRDARRAARRRVVALRKPPDKADAAFGPNPKGMRMAGALRRCRCAHGSRPTALAAPRTASRHSHSHSRNWREQALVTPARARCRRRWPG